MNHGLNRKVDQLEEKAAKDLKQKVYDIYIKYGNNGDQVDANASDYERQVLMRYHYPKALERFRWYLPVFLPDVMKGLFEIELYPLLYRVKLSESIREDDDTFLLEYHLDRIYEQTVHPELTKEFWNEVLASFERDDERFPQSDVAKRWRDSRSECDALKEQSYLRAIEKLKHDAEYEAETMRLEALEQAKDASV